MLEPQDFRDVLVIARERSLKAAAAVLRVDPSTMGRRLEGVEARFGARVFMRTARGFELTPEGADIAATAEKLEALQLSFQREILARDPRRTNALTITAAEWGVPLLTPLLVELATSHPDVQLHLRIENRKLDLTRREADIALRVGRPSEKALVGKRVGVVVYGLYGSSAYLETRTRPRSAEEVARHALIAMDASFARAPHVRWQSALAREARVVLQTNSMLALIEAVRAGGGLATLPCALADRMPELKRVLPDSASVQRDLWLLFHRDLRRSRAVRALVDELVARLRPKFALLPASSCQGPPWP